MQLTIEGQLREFILLQNFRAERDLPDNFNVNSFEPKVWVSLGSMNSTHTSEGLELLKAEVLKAVPAVVQMNDLLRVVDDIAKTFSLEFQTVNTHIRLKSEEVEFATSGFHNVMHDVAYTLLRLNHIHQGERERICSAFNFQQVYQNWIDASTRISAMTHFYVHHDINFKVRVIYNVYGRVGLEVREGDRVFYLADMSLACPASNYMMTLCEETTQKLCGAVLGNKETPSEDKENTN